MALIGAVALIVIGPEKLPRVARTVGTLLGKAQRYVSDVKAEVNRSMELDELKKMKETVEGAARDVEELHPDPGQRVREPVVRRDTARAESQRRRRALRQLSPATSTPRRTGA
jgi:sec-independent protein translocase protein TatB